MKLVVLLVVLSMLQFLCSCQKMMDSDPTDTVVETQTGAETETESQTKAETETESQTTAETETESQTTAETETESQTEAETEAETVDPFEIYDWRDWCYDKKTISFVDTSPTINHEEEYRVFCQYFESSLPDQFITYDQLSTLGNYDCFILLELLQDGQWKYMYDIHEEGEQYLYGCYGITLKITGLTDDKARNVENYRSLWEEQNVYEETGNIDDMTATNTCKDSYKVINYHDIDYCYSTAGNLYYVKLVIDDYLVQILQGSVYVNGEFEPCNFKDYAPAEPNFITLLLEGAEYEEVANSFREMIATDAE